MMEITYIKEHNASLLMQELWIKLPQLKPVKIQGGWNIPLRIFSNFMEGKVTLVIPDTIDVSMIDDVLNNHIIPLTIYENPII